MPIMPLLHDSCGLERDVLVQLAALTEPRGAEIVEAIDEAYPSGVNQSRIYQILQSLERQGLADSRDVDGRSKVYWVTDEGREAVREYHDWTAERVPED